VSAAAGWYADPSGVPGQLRWWDGSRWTDHVTPDPSAVPAAAGAPGAAGAHGGDDGVAEVTQPPPPAGAPGPVPAWGAGSDGTWGSGDAARPAWQVDTPVPTSGSSVKTWLIVAAVVGVVLIGLVAVLIVGVMRAGNVVIDGFEDGSFEVGASDGPVTDGGRLGVGDQGEGEVPVEGAHEFAVDIEQGGTYAIDVRAQGDLDAMLELYGPDGELVAENDDRDFDVDGGDTLDPYLEVDLEPGEHRVVVRGWGGDDGPFTLTVDRR
jgi:hypothetical protein